VTNQNKMKSKKKFAIPTVGNVLTPHFGHCERFTIVETEDDQILSVHYLSPPVHQPGSYPRFLADQGVNVIISGGMGFKAQDLFAENNIEVCIGVSSDSPEYLVEQYLKNQLTTGENLCDH
jgi:predicted Fe-Mo cluster-binding NifX family protein